MTYQIMITDENGIARPFMLASSMEEAHELACDHIRRSGKPAPLVDVYIQYNGTFQLRYETEELRAQVIRQALLLRRILDSAVEVGGYLQPMFEAEIPADMLHQIHAEVFAAPLPSEPLAVTEPVAENEECPF